MKKWMSILLFGLAGIMYAQSPGNALNFDGTNDFVNATPPALFSNLSTNSFTYEAWVYPTGNLFARIIFAQPSTTNFSSMGTGAGNVIYFYVIANGTTYSRASSTSIPQNQWTHVACRWTASTLTPEIFFNGVLQPTVAGGSSSTGTNGIMAIGTRPGGGTQYFPGSLDDIRVWSEARTQCQIASNMNSEFTSPQPTLAAYYNCNQGIPGGPNAPFTTLPDINSSYNGTLNNFALSGATSNWIASGAVINQVGPSIFSSSTSATICDGDSYSFGGNMLTTSGTYYDTVLTAAGCDSMITLNLSVISPTGTNINVVTCNQYLFNSTLLDSTGIYYDTLTTVTGCDSIITLDLTIYYNQSVVVAASACNQYVFDATLLTASGTYYDTLTSVNGCDSMITLNLTIHNDVSDTIVASACGQYFFNGNFISATGMYYDTLTTVNSCDSLIVLDLTINSVNTGVSQSGPQLTSNASGATYQWLDCDNSFAAISGETGITFTAAMNGNYAVAVTENGCTDTSACFNVNSFGIGNTLDNFMVCYPNPTDGMVTVRFSNSTLPEKLMLLTVDGKCLQTILITSEIIQLDLGGYEPGIYLIQYQGKNFTGVKRVIRK